MAEPDAMADRTTRRAHAGLAPTPALALAAKAIELREVTDRALVTIALPDDAVRERLARAFGVALPRMGESVVTDAGERLLGLQPDRLYVLFEHPGAALAEGAAGNGVASPAEPATGATAALAAERADPERALLERIAASAPPPAPRVPTDTDATGNGAGRDTSNDPGGADGATLLYSSDQSDAWCLLRLDGSASRRALERVCPLDLHRDAFGIGAVARSVVEHLGAIVLREDENAFLLLSPRSSAGSFLHEIERSVRHLRAGP